MLKNISRHVGEYGKDVRICWIEPMFEDRHVFLFGQDLSFLIKIKSVINKENLRFGISIFDLLGNVVVASFSSEKLPVRKNYENKYLIKITDICLAPGDYRIALSFGYGSLQKAHRNLDAVLDGPVFEIARIGFNENDVIKWDHSWGNIYHEKVSVTTIKNTESISHC